MSRRRCPGPGNFCCLGPVVSHSVLILEIAAVNRHCNHDGRENLAAAHADLMEELNGEYEKQSGAIEKMKAAIHRAEKKLESMKKKVLYELADHCP